MRQCSPKPYRIEFSDEMLRDLGDRLNRTRWPEVPPQEPWTTGTSITYLRDLVDYWRNHFDWRAQETLLNKFQQSKAPVGGIIFILSMSRARAQNRCRSSCLMAGRDPS